MSETITKEPDTEKDTKKGEMRLYVRLTSTTLFRVHSCYGNHREHAVSERCLPMPGEDAVY